MVNAGERAEFTPDASLVPAPMAVVRKAGEMQQHAAKWMSGEPCFQVMEGFAHSLWFVQLIWLKFICIHEMLLIHWLEPVR
jgi:hypothetical protein